jgi:hypothetical protein
MQPDGGVVVDYRYRCFLTQLEKESGADDKRARQSQAAGGSCSRQKLGALVGACKPLLRGRRRDDVHWL